MLRGDAFVFAGLASITSSSLSFLLLFLPLDLGVLALEAILFFALLGVDFGVLGVGVPLLLLGFEGVVLVFTGGAVVNSALDTC